MGTKLLRGVSRRGDDLMRALGKKAGAGRRVEGGGETETEGGKKTEEDDT